MSMSFDQTRRIIEGELNPPDKFSIWVKDLFDDRVVIDDDGRFFEMTYEIKEGGEVVFGDRTEVQVTYAALAEFNAVEVLKAGTFTDMLGREVTFTGEDLDAVVKNGNELSDVIKAPLVATHDEGFDMSVGVFGSVDGGKFHNYRRDGDKVLADIKGSPQKVADLLGEVEEMRLSPEVYKDFTYEGQSHGLAISRVAWVPVPAIKDLAGITDVNLFEDSRGQPTTWVRLAEAPPRNTKKKEDDSMKDDDKVKLAEAEEAQKKAEADAAEEKKRADDATAKLAEHDAAKKKEKVASICDSMKGLSPVAIEEIKYFAEGLDSTGVLKFGEKEETPLDRFSGLLESLVVRDKEGNLTVKFGEMAPGDDDRGGEESENLAKEIAAGAKE